MEAKEMMEIYADFPVIVDLIKLREDSRSNSAMKDQILMLEQGLQFLVIYMEILSFFSKGLENKERELNFSRRSGLIEATLRKKRLSEAGFLALDKGKFHDWGILSSEMLKEIESYKPFIKEDCVFFSDGPSNGYRFTANFLPKFMRYTLVSMANALNQTDGMYYFHKEKFESIREMLDTLRIIFNYVKDSNRSFSDLHGVLNAWVLNSSYLCILYWVLDRNLDYSISNTRSKFYKQSDFLYLKVSGYCLNHIKQYHVPVEERSRADEFVSLAITIMFLSYLMAKETPPANDCYEALEIFYRFTESLHWKLRAYLSKEAIEMLRDGMTFLLAFIIDPPPSERTNEQTLALTESQKAVKLGATLITSLGSDKKDEAGIDEVTNFRLHDFFEMVITIKEKFWKTYSHLFLDPPLNLPWNNVLNLFAASIENFQDLHSRFSNRPFFTFEKQLVVLREILEALNLKDKFLLELQNDDTEFKDLWSQISYVAYQAYRITGSYPHHDVVGHDNVFLYVHEKIKHLFPIFMRVKEKIAQGSYICNPKMNSNPITPLKFDVQEMDEVVVGFDAQAEEIRDLLINQGSEKLNFISIVGMGGLGKTTLAKKVYNDPLVKSHFTPCVWCTVSQSCDSKQLLFDILKDVTDENNSCTKKEEEDLDDNLRKCLKGKRYLIVMDDIWDVGAWNAIKLSFPDDKNHSRILFTSRNHIVVANDMSDSVLYPLRQLSNEESWELLERKLFQDKDSCPSKFVQCGKKIATDCNGLPLAVVLVAGLLKREIENLDWWKQIGESVDSKVSEEGCAQILELSYEHLFEPLKPCFLYLGLFQEDKVIEVNKLIKLWVSEGLVQKKGRKDLELVAKEYVMDLIGRSLLIVCGKSSYGGIKTCRIHDLLRTFCLEKSKQEKFFMLLHGKDVPDYCMDEHYRVSIQTQHWKDFLVKESSLLYSIHISPAGTSNTFNISHNSFSNARFLHVLNLEEVIFVGDFPEEITTLIFLRYLAICCTTNFAPKDITRLRNLETLRLFTKENFILPIGFFRMESLRHVYIGKFFPHALFDTKPMKNIHSFSTPCFTYGKDAKLFLDRLQAIQKLKCQFNSYHGNEMVKLDFLDGLQSLNMTHNEPPRPKSFVFCLPTGIKKLTLSNFGLPWSEISRIAELQNLEVLKLLVDAFMGEDWNIETEFRRLKFLKLQGLNVKRWSASHENFPSLEQIVVEQCRQLEKIPTEFVDISTLQSIYIRRCRSSVVDSANEIKDEQIELGTMNFRVEAVQILPKKLHG